MVTVWQEAQGTFKGEWTVHTVGVGDSSVASVVAEGTGDAPEQCSRACLNFRTRPGHNLNTGRSGARREAAPQDSVEGERALKQRKEEHGAKKRAELSTPRSWLSEEPGQAVATKTRITLQSREAGGGSAAERWPSTHEPLGPTPRTEGE